MQLFCIFINGLQRIIRILIVGRRQNIVNQVMHKIPNDNDNSTGGFLKLEKVNSIEKVIDKRFSF